MIMNSNQLKSKINYFLFNLYFIEFSLKNDKISFAPSLESQLTNLSESL